MQTTDILAWLTVDMNGDSKTEIVQAYNNNGQLKMNIYTPDGTYPFKLKNLYNVGQGSGAVKWLTANFSLDHLNPPKAE